VVAACGIFSGPAFAVCVMAGRALCTSTSIGANCYSVCQQSICACLQHQIPCGQNVFCTGACPTGYRCYDGTYVSSCASGTSPCGATCCSSGSTCLASVLSLCCPKGGTLCGTTCCPASSTCVDDICCPSDAIACGTTCCPLGQCVEGVCGTLAACGGFYPTGCPDGYFCCSFGEQAPSNICCNNGFTCCYENTTPPLAVCCNPGSTCAPNGGGCNLG
jgi:hypothetical protein